MWLLDIKTIQLRLFDNISDAPPFAALSHCWESNEVTFADLRDHDKARRKAGYQKLLQACRIVEGMGLQWLWADTVCINRSSIAELTECVNSTFRWYRQCRVCIVYLSDYRSDYQSSEQQQHDEEVKTRLSQCRWMRRSWTLQELIAPSTVLFYDGGWSPVGSKENLAPILSEITRIDMAALKDPDCLFEFSVGRRMSWAANREARHTEDIAYSLVGIFRVSMPVLYGEGRRAFIKLQEEIMKETDDASLFAWKANGDQQYRGVLAHAPSEFGHFAHRTSTAPFRIRGDIYITATGLIIEDEFGNSAAGQDVILCLYSEDEPDTSSACLGLPFREWNDRWVRSTPQLFLVLPRPPSHSTRRLRLIRDVDERECGTISRDVKYSRNRRRQSLGLLKYSTTAKRTCTGDSVTRPPSLAQPPSPVTVSSSIGNIFRNHAKSVDTDEVWSAVGTRPTPSLAPPSNPDKPSYIECMSPEASSRPGCLSPRALEYNNSERGDEEQLSVYHDTISESGDSAEDDMHLFMVSAIKQPELDPRHIFAQVKDELAESALQELPQYFSQHASTKRVKEASTSSAPKRRKSGSGPFDGHVEVHKPLDQEDEDILLVDYIAPERPSLACPFYRHDPAKYQTCLRRANLQSVKAVKRHIWTHHRRPYFCPACRKIFETSMECNAHVRRRDCTVIDGPEIEGITEDQEQDLVPKPNPCFSVQTQWFAIWNIIFPREDPPLLPFLTGNVESLVCLVKEYWASQGKEFIAKFLQAKEMCDYDQVPDEERNLQALYGSVLNQLVDTVVDRLTVAEAQSTSLGTTWTMLDVIRRICSQTAV